MAVIVPTNLQMQAALLVDTNGNPLAAGAPTAISGPLGRAADAASLSTALSTEDVALLNSLIARFTAAGVLADGSANFNTTVVGAANEVFNGTTWDRQIGNVEGTLFASAARTATTVFVAGQVNYNARGIIIYLNVTVASGTGGLQVQVNGIDPISANPFILHASFTAVTATGQKAYILYPGAASSGGNVATAVQTPLPRTWQVRVVAGDSSSYTYSVSYSLIV